MTDEITNVQSGYFTQERIQGDLDYRRAQTIAKKMLDDGLISVAEFNKLTAINRETFSPLFVRGNNAENPLICSRFRVMYRRTERRDFP